MLSLNGVMIGVNCAVLCMTGTNVRTTIDWRGKHPLGWKVYYKKNSVSSWTVKDCDSDGDTVFFRDSSSLFCFPGNLP